MKWKPLLIVVAVGLLGIVAYEAVSRSDRQATTVQKDTVVLLHGLGRTTRSMRRMEKQLLREGFRVVNVAYPSTREPVETLATRYLGPALSAQCRRPGGKIHFVTHSMGGIVLGYYLKYNAVPNLGRVVMLCPPSRGSEIADRLRDNVLFQLVAGPSGRQLGTGRESLPNQLGDADYELGIIAGDRSMNPWASALIPGADDGKVAINRAGAGGMQDFLVMHNTHTFIMRDRAVIDQVVFFIGHGFFNTNRPGRGPGGDKTLFHRNRSGKPRQALRG